MKKIVILVVEDEPLLRVTTVLELEDLRFDVRQAGNASEALASLEKMQDVDVVFTDIDMPGHMSGIGLSHMIESRWPVIKIIVTSGHRPNELDALPPEARFFRKPYMPARVACAARDLMGCYR